MLNKRSFTKLALGSVLALIMATGLEMSTPAHAGKVGGAVKYRAPDLDKVYTCKSVPKGTPTTTLTVHLERFSIPAWWSESGPHYEIVNGFTFDIFASKNAIKPLCSNVADNVISTWGTREYPKLNFSTDGRWTYPLDLKLIIHNVPVNGVAKFTFFMWEDDVSYVGANNHDDEIDLAEGQARSAHIRVYPSERRGYLVKYTNPIDKHDSKHLVMFGQSKRIAGLGEGQTAIGTLDFTIDTPKKVGGAKSTVSCQQYAQNAVNRNAEAAKLGCGFKSPEWSSNVQMHYDWCMRGNNAARAADADARRASAIKNCKANQPGAGKGNACQNYALTSVQQNQQAIKKNCGFKSPEWSNDHQSHFNWCMQGNNYKAASDHIARRAKDLQNCTAKPKGAGNENACRSYALTAVNLNQQAIQKNCGFKPPVWSNNHQMHFDWCMRGNNSKGAAKENAKRFNAIKSCKTGSSKTPNPPSATQYCQIYAQDALNQFHSGQQRGCGFQGPEWSPQFTWHYNWCVQTYKAGNIAAIAAGTSKRNAMLASCN